MGDIIYGQSLMHKIIQLVSNFQGPFVAAFASTNLGDVSPNLKGPKCIDSGKECDLYHSTCEGRTQNCIASGPGNDMKESTYIIGNRQFQESKVNFFLIEDLANVGFGFEF